MSTQQSQTLDFFDRTAAAWNEKAARPYSIIPDRNRCAITVLRSSSGKSLIDLGCGAGQLVIEAAKLGSRAVGIDFAPDMVAISKKNAEGVSGAEFRVASIFDVPADLGTFDVVSGMGLIEYLPLNDLREFFATCRNLLNPGGRLALGSRNRLFNLVTHNDYTALESAETISFLVNEASLLTGAKTQQEAMAALSRGAFKYAQPASHPSTGIGVDVRYQFSPRDLISRALPYFRPARIFPVHFHALPTHVKAEERELHDRLAKSMMETRGEDHRLVPWCSSFVLEFERL